MVGETAEACRASTPSARRGCSLAPRTKKRLYSTASQIWPCERSEGVAYKGISVEDLRPLSLPPPAVTDQLKIVRSVDAVLKLAGAIEMYVAVAIARAGKATQVCQGVPWRVGPTEAEVAPPEGMHLPGLHKGDGSAAPRNFRSARKG